MTRYEGVGTVLATRDGGRPRLCLGMVARSDPPAGCGGVPLGGWSWDGVPGVQRKGGTTWAPSLRVVGTWDGSTLTVTEPPRLPLPGEGAPHRVRAAVPPTCDDACVVDRARVTQADFGRLVDVTASLPGVVASWVDQRGSQEPEDWAWNVYVTDDAAGARRALRAVWGGGLCVVERPDLPTPARLDAIRSGLREAVEPDTHLLVVGADPLHGVVHAEVPVVTEAMRVAVAERCGAAAVELHPRLRALDDT